jgi:hypothetical protein
MGPPTPNKKDKKRATKDEDEDKEAKKDKKSDNMNCPHQKEDKKT